MFDSFIFKWIIQTLTDTHTHTHTFESKYKYYLNYYIVLEQTIMNERLHTFRIAIIFTKCTKPSGFPPSLSLLFFTIQTRNKDIGFIINRWIGSSITVISID